MARIRTFKPEIWSDAKFSQLSDRAQLLVFGCMNWADDWGRARFSPKEIEAFIWPFKTVGEFPGIFREVLETGIVHLYQVGDERFFYFPNWDKHQSIKDRKKSRLPSPDEGFGIAWENSGKFREVPRNPPLGTGEQGNRGTGEIGTEEEGTGEKEEDDRGGANAPVFLTLVEPSPVSLEEPLPGESPPVPPPPPEAKGRRKINYSAFFDAWWGLRKWGGSKEEAYVEWKRRDLDADEELRARVMAATVEQIAHRAEAARRKIFVANFKHGCRWLAKAMWDENLEELPPVEAAPSNLVPLRPANAPPRSVREVGQSWLEKRREAGL